MRKDEKMENTIEKIQRDFMRYTQLKLNGFKTLMTSDRLDADKEYHGDKRKKGGGTTSKKQGSMRTRFNQNSDLGNMGEFNQTNRRKGNKSVLNFAGKMMMEERRTRGVGFDQDNGKK